MAPIPRVLPQYALLADGEPGILVGPRGDYCWMCLPHWHSGAVFNSLPGGAGADHQQGNDLAAVRWFERNRTACGPPRSLQRNSISNNISYAAICHRLSSTLCCWHRLAGRGLSGPGS